MTLREDKKIKEIQMVFAYVKIILLLILSKTSAIEYVRILIMLKNLLDQHKLHAIVIQDMNGMREEQHVIFLVVVVSMLQLLMLIQTNNVHVLQMHNITLI